MSFIPAEDYEKIIEVLPVLCVDIVIQNSTGKYLLIKRVNEPLKGQWWVVGGRVHKNESLEHAAIRKVKEEVSLNLSNIFLLGYYEEVFNENPFDLECSLHTVSVVFSTVVSGSQKIKLDSQSSDWKYSSVLPSNFSYKGIIL
jgi:colanic acid biosynthesis protein WcaH